MTRTPKISVCLLAYNHGKIIGDSIRSVLAQEFDDFEVIISDDCSTDETWRVIEGFTNDPRVRAIRPERNLGMAGNANFAASKARGDHVALLHHDDIYSPDLLRRWLDVMERYPDVGFVSNSYGAYGREDVDYHPFSEYTPGHIALEKYLFARWGCPVRGTALIKRACWNELGGMRERFGMLADVDLWMRLAARWAVGYVREPLIIVRHERPDDYPEAYVSPWSWKRQRILYDIHGVNRREYFGNTPRGKLELARYRAKVSAHELFWLGYAAARGRKQMLSTCNDAQNEYELPPARWIREAIHLVSSTLSASSERARR